jgi:hypothetical protein
MQCSKWAGIPYRNFFSFLNFIPVSVSIYVYSVHLSFLHFSDGISLSRFQEIHRKLYSFHFEHWFHGSRNCWHKKWTTEHYGYVLSESLTFQRSRSMFVDAPNVWTQEILVKTKFHTNQHNTLLEFVLYETALVSHLTVVQFVGTVSRCNKHFHFHRKYIHY